MILRLLHCSRVFDQGMYAVEEEQDPYNDFYEGNLRQIR